MKKICLALTVISFYVLLVSSLVSASERKEPLQITGGIVVGKDFISPLEKGIVSLGQANSCESQKCLADNVEKPTLLTSDKKTIMGDVEISRWASEYLNPQKQQKASAAYLSSVVIKIPYTDYTTVSTAHTHFIGGCIKRTVPHIGFLISKKGQTKPVTDLHVAAWTENGRVCIGFYISPQNRCWKICSPTYSQIKNTIITALVAAGISYTVAQVIAAILTPITLGALAI